MAGEFIDIRVDNAGLASLVSDLTVLENVFPIAARSVSGLLAQEGRSLLQRAWNLSLGDARAFPLIYIIHMQRSLNLLLPFVVTASNSGLNVQVRDPEELGDFSDLERARHFHAIDGSEYPLGFSVSNPPRVDLPGPDQELYAYISQSGDRREEYWKAIVAGKESFEIQLNSGGKRGAKGRFTGGGETRTQVVQIPSGALNDTYRARVLEWGYRFPEWIMYLNGWTDGLHSTPPSAFLDYLEVVIEDFAVQAFTDIVENIVAQIDAGTLRISSGYARATTGNTGRFAPYLEAV